MLQFPEPLQNLVDALARLPGIGPKTAARLTFFLLRAPESITQDLADALLGLHSQTDYCPECYNITTKGNERCEICADARRDKTLICVVEDALDVIALERAANYNGLYHVLQGVLSPIEGVGPDDLTIQALLERIRSGSVQEIIIATNPSLEGDATAMYLSQQLSTSGLKITRLARGLPVGGDLEYADQSTLLRAMSGRQEMG
jgi:recombination protein RecR